MRYLVVEAHSAEELQEKVQKCITEGWEPSGGMAVATYGAISWWYYQAMVMHRVQEPGDPRVGSRVEAEPGRT
jgi:hypothetical protein